MAPKQAKKDPTPRKYWKMIVNFFAHLEDHITNKTNKANEPDPAAKIQKYIDVLGADRNAGENADFVCVCYDALRGDGDTVLQQQILKTLAWRKQQLLLIQNLIHLLEDEGLVGRRNVIFRFRKPKDVSDKVYNRLWKITGVRCLFYPPGDDMVPSFFPEGAELLFRSIIERYKDSESLEEAAHKIHDILGQATENATEMPVGSSTGYPEGKPTVTPGSYNAKDDAQSGEEKTDTQGSSET